jgi:hypothetical protein
MHILNVSITVQGLKNVSLKVLEELITQSIGAVFSKNAGKVILSSTTCKYF